MAKDIYVKLQEQIDQYSIGFPKSASGIEIKILKKLFQEDEAQIYLDLSLQLETPDVFASRTDRDPNQAALQLEAMANKGLLFRKTTETSNRYAAIPFIVGIFEFQLNTMDKELSQMMEDYCTEVYSKDMARGIQPLRTVPVNKSVDIIHKVSSFMDAREMIKSKEKISIARCICRAQKGLLDGNCGKPEEVCFSFGSHADYYVANNMARFITPEEGLKILDECEEAGLVNQPANMVNPGGMCNCCGDCCGILRAIKTLPNPADHVTNNFRAVVDKSLCTACELCFDRCQMEAIEMGDDDTIEILNNRCIGCGLCVTTCPGEALSLVQKPEAEHQDPPANGMELMLKNAEKRGTTLIPFSMAETKK